MVPAKLSIKEMTCENGLSSDWEQLRSSGLVKNVWLHVAGPLVAKSWPMLKIKSLP